MHHAFIGLHAGAVAFLDAHIDDDGVARAEFGYGALGGNSSHLLFFELLDDIHGSFLLGLRAYSRVDPENQFFLSR